MVRRAARELGRAARRRGAVRRSLPLLALLLAACAPGGSPVPSEPTGTLEIRVVAGPVCPVETEEPDPACDPRPVAGARILVAPGDGRDIVVAEGTTDEDGIVRLTLAAGDYLVSGLEVAGLFGVPELASASVIAGEVTILNLAYDTGIR
jgi:hypothetical protein